MTRHGTQHQRSYNTGAAFAHLHLDKPWRTDKPRHNLPSNGTDGSFDVLIRAQGWLVAVQRKLCVLVAIKLHRQTPQHGLDQAMEHMPDT